MGYETPYTNDKSGGIQLAEDIIGLLSTPDKWCQGDMAQNMDGRACDADEPQACKWCLAGAIFKLTGIGGDTFHDAMFSAPDAVPSEFMDALDDSVKEMTHGIESVNTDYGEGPKNSVATVEQFNDEHQWHEVMWAVQRAKQKMGGDTPYTGGVPYVG